MTRPTFVVLGASNVARALPWVVAGARDRIGEPLAVQIATGRGRSYGVRAGLLGITRPGIVDCSLWKDLPDGPGGALDALVTDVGNDLLYGSDVAVIARWVETCLERLVERGARTIVLTGLPLERLRELGPGEFGFWARLLFPTRKLDFERVRAATEELQERLAALASSYGATWIVPQRPWYGLDPIHIRRRDFQAAWSSILAPFDRAREDLGSFGGRGGSPGAELRARLARAGSAEVRFFGWRQASSQPSARCREGTTIGLY